MTIEEAILAKANQISGQETKILQAISALAGKMGYGNADMPAEYEVMNDACADFIENAYEDSYEAFDFDDTEADTYREDTLGADWYRGDQPNSHEITLKTSGELIVFDTANGGIFAENKPSGSTVIENLTPGSRAFYINHCAGGISQCGSVVARGQVRMIKTDTAYSTYKSGNVRDLGGWECDGGTIAYNKIFRGARFNGGNVHTSDRDKKIFHDLLKIRDEIDLRGNNDVSGISSSAFGEDVDYKHFPILMYSSGLTGSANLYREIITRIAEDLKNGKAVYIHCLAGADRTGCVCAILEALCGVSLKDIDKDYELTSFTNFLKPDGTHTEEYIRYRNDDDGRWEDFINELNGCEGDTFRDSVAHWCASIGVSLESINTIRHCLIDGSPEDITLSTPQYTISFTSAHCSINNTSPVLQGQSYSATITVAEGYEIDNVSVSMGGSTITSSAVTAQSTSSVSISISSVTGNVTIVVATSALQEPDIDPEPENEPVNVLENFEFLGNSYDAITLANNTRISSTDGAAKTSNASGIVATSLIPITDGAVIRIKGITIPEASTGVGTTQYAYYKDDAENPESAEKIFVGSIALRLGTNAARHDAEGFYISEKSTSNGETEYIITVQRGTYSTSGVTVVTTSAQYVRISAEKTGDVAITLQEPNNTRR